MELKLDIKKLFFDSKEVIEKADKATRSVLSKFGAYVRQTARQSIRSRKKPSEPGQPPSNHVGTVKRLIFFGLEGNKNVVIGPTQFNGQANMPYLEYGGNERKGRKTLHYSARPFMQPAFEATKKKLPDMWRDSIK